MSVSQDPIEAGRPVRARRILSMGVVGAVLLWLAQPPVGWWPLAWVAPAFWIGPATTDTKYRAGDYARVWASASLYWLLALHWIRLPHPLTPLGWPPLAMYLGCYLLATVWLLRAGRRVARAPVWIVAPVAWVGMELVQARLFTGFLMGAVSHTQAGQPWIRSVAAFGGAYAVTFCVVAFAAAAVASVRLARSGRLASGLLLLGAVSGAVAALGRGAERGCQPPDARDPLATVALIQGDSRAVWDADPLRRNQEIMDRHAALTVEALQKGVDSGRSIDLVVWPESMFRPSVCTFEGSVDPPPDASEGIRRVVDSTNENLRALSIRGAGAWFLLGVDRFDERDASTTDLYNSAALVDDAGAIAAIYDKTHLVPFGEYIPLARGLPALYYLTPMAGGLNAGAGPVAMTATLRNGDDLRLCPTICYETVIPHVVRSHVARLTASGTRPDALVNITNDAWFWGSSELPMHIACGVFRAVETGTPLLIAANGGISAVIDATGEVVQSTLPMTEAILIEGVPPRLAEPTLYVLWGDWFAVSCLALCLAVSIASFVTRSTDPTSNEPTSESGSETP